MFQLVALHAASVYHRKSDLSMRHMQYMSLNSQSKSIGFYWCNSYFLLFAGLRHGSTMNGSMRGGRPSVTFLRQTSNSLFTFVTEIMPHVTSSGLNMFQVSTYCFDPSQPIAVCCAPLCSPRLTCARKRMINGHWVESTISLFSLPRPKQNRNSFENKLNWQREMMVSFRQVSYSQKFRPIPRSCNLPACQWHHFQPAEVDPRFLRRWKGETLWSKLKGQAGRPQSSTCSTFLKKWWSR